MIRIINEEVNDNDAKKSYIEFMKIVSEVKKIPNVYVRIGGDDPSSYLGFSASNVKYSKITSAMKKLGYEGGESFSYEFVKEVSNNESYYAEVKNALDHTSINFQAEINGEYYPSR